MLEEVLQTQSVNSQVLYRSPAHRGIFVVDFEPGLVEDKKKERKKKAFIHWCSLPVNANMGLQWKVVPNFWH